MSEETQTSLTEMVKEPVATTTPEVDAEKAQNSEVAENEVAGADATDANKDDAGEEGGDADSDDVSNESEKPKAKKGFEKRISKEVARKNEALREAEYWKKVALERGATQETAAQPQRTEAADKPKFSDYNDIESYTEAVTDWKMERKLEQIQQQSKAKTVEETYNSRVKEFEKTRPDFQEVLADSDLQISKPVTDLIFESDVGPAIVMYLAENEEETERINGMSQVRQLAEIGKIEAKLSKIQSGKSSNGAASSEKKLSKAPAPVKTVSGGAPVTTKSLDDPGLSPEEWIKMRNKQRNFR